MALDNAIRGLARLEGELDASAEEMLRMLVALGWHLSSVFLQDILARRGGKL